jgi:hypothetical protein
MRIWNEQLIPKLCRQHLLACWREGLGAYSIITENKKGYSQHPAVKEFEGYPVALLWRLFKVRNEMIFRGYKPKELPKREYHGEDFCGIIEPEPWQTLEQQIEILKSKKCQCNI